MILNLTYDQKEALLQLTSDAQRPELHELVQSASTDVYFISAYEFDPTIAQLDLQYVTGHDSLGWAYSELSQEYPSIEEHTLPAEHFMYTLGLDRPDVTTQPLTVKEVQQRLCMENAILSLHIHYKDIGNRYQLIALETQPGVLGVICGAW